MQQSLNPWITRPAPADGAEAAAPDAHVPPAAVISAPLRGMVEPDAADRLARRTVAGSAALWVTGAHGGSGESRIADLIDGARATDHCWPVLPGRIQAPGAAGLPCRHARPDSRTKRPDPVGIRRGTGG